MAPPRKTLFEYVKEARWEGKCLVHPSRHAARRTYKLRHGDIPSTTLVCHTCDNPHCIWGAHHFPGTSGDNVRDAVEKGRHSCFRKGGVRFSGKHTTEAKQKISVASRRMWEERRALQN